MAIEEDLYARLIGDATLASYIGDRVFPSNVPDYNTPRPYIVFHLTDRESLNALSTNQFRKASIDFEVLADTYLLARSIGDTIISLLDGWRGGSVRRCSWMSDSIEQIDDGIKPIYLYTAVYEVIDQSPTVVASASSTSRVVTNANTIDFQPTPGTTALTVSTLGINVVGGISINGSLLVIPDGTAIYNAAIQRANHTGTQSVSTIVGLGSLAYISTLDLATQVTGKLSDSNLSSNVPLLNASNTFSTFQIISVPSISTAAVRVQLSGTTKIQVQGDFVSWPSIAAGDVAGLRWFRSGSYDARLRSDTANGDLVFYNASSGSEVEVGRLQLAGGISFKTGTTTLSTNLTLGATTDSTAQTVSGNRYTGSSATDSLSLRTFRSDGGGLFDRVTITQGGGGGIGTAIVQLRHAEQRFQIQSSTATIRDVCGMVPSWIDSTDATRLGRMALTAFSTTTAQEGIRIDANSGGVRIGFYGQTAVARQTLPASGSVTAADIRQALINLGLCQ